ncbi:hypothetical protein B0J12DRAFT_368754 [Macrophomina phaseolina]|uniref:Rhodopsin domain-containing protein n=1 Tax=Macrophomina phaseolina TaxID=35725 RepID=A0ABQ8GJQ3_9PEZI|nr:hypothetical protein B0J12DRAFT_368754 [Macrophomina phaseolina]
MGAVSSSEYRALLENTPAYKAYDPDAPVVRVRHDAILALVCTCNAFSRKYGGLKCTFCTETRSTVIIMCGRVVAQWKRFGIFRLECWWNAVTAVILIFPFWTSQLMLHHYGAGLHMKNVKMEWRIPHWRWTLPWASFYVLEAMVKMSMCFTLLHLIPFNFKLFRRAIYSVCIIMLGLGFAVVFVWIFQCRPVKSNFTYAVKREWCADFNAVRYSWVGIAIAIDLALVYIPLKIIRMVSLSSRERRTLQVVFCGNLLGTAASAIAIYGIWESRFPQAERDLHWKEAILVMYNSVEILLYTLGGSLVVFSRFFVARVARRSSLQECEGHHRGLPMEEEKALKGLKGQRWYLRSFDMSRSDPATVHPGHDPDFNSIMRRETDSYPQRVQDKDSLFAADGDCFGE